jgi:hypothetical protein
LDYEKVFEVSVHQRASMMADLPLYLVAASRDSQYSKACNSRDRACM